MALASCNNPLNKVYNEEKFSTDLKEIVESKKVDTADVGYIAVYLMRAKMLGEKLEGKTYADLLDKAKEIRKTTEKEMADQNALAEKAANEEREKRALFAQTLTVALYDKGYYTADYEDYLQYEVAYENKGTKGIRALKGSLLISDLFDTKIKEISLVEDNAIPAGKISRRSYTTEYNQFLDEDVRLASKKLGDLKVVWIPEKIIFEDGTTLE